MHYYSLIAPGRTRLSDVRLCVANRPIVSAGTGVRVMDVVTFAHPSQQLPTPARGDRVAGTREAIIGSALALALAGAVAPIVRDIAKAAGVSARTVFQHFADTAELYVAVL